MNRNLFRLDRFATLNLSYPIHRIFRKDSDSAVPILMYHSISDPDNRFLHPYFETCTSSKVFEEHIKYLSENGYSSIGLDDLHGALKKGTNAGKYVVLTFDDGYLNFLDNAFPILDKYSFKATVFLATGLMGKRRKDLLGKDIMGWSDARQLQDKGIVFGSHTVNHLKLNRLPLEVLAVEIGESKKEIESRLGASPASFSYPYAFPEENVDFLGKYFEILERCGYRTGVTTVIGRVGKGDNPLALKRLPINDLDDLVLFKAKLDGAYDWVHVPQYLWKKYFNSTRKHNA